MTIPTPDESGARCELCGEPMPPGEEMFKYHGYSCPCPKPPSAVTLMNPLPEGAIFSRGRLVEFWKQNGGAVDKKGRAWIEVDLLAPLLNSIVERALPFALKERRSTDTRTEVLEEAAKVADRNQEDFRISRLGGYEAYPDTACKIVAAHIRALKANTPPPREGE